MRRRARAGRASPVRSRAALGALTLLTVSAVVGSTSAPSVAASAPVASAPVAAAPVAAAPVAAAPVPAAPVAAAPAADGDVLTLLGDHGFPFSDASAAYRAGELDVVTMSADQGREAVIATGRTAGAMYSTRVEIAASATAGELRPGRHEFRYDEPDTAAVVVRAEPETGLRCWGDSGWFDVLDLTRGADGRLTGIAVDYGIECPADGKLVRGSLRWGSTEPYRFTSASQVYAPPTAPGVVRREAITVTNGGTLPQTYGTAVWQPDPGDRAGTTMVVDDGCAGVTLGPRQSCTVGLTLSTTGPDIAGRFRIPDETVRGAVATRVFVPGVAAPTPPSLVASSSRGAVTLGGGKDSLRYRVLRQPVTGTTVEEVVAPDVRLPWTDSSAVPGVTYRYRAVAMAGGLEAESSAPVTAVAMPVPEGSLGTFVPLDPVRVVDTRDGTGGRRGPLGQQETMTFDPAADGVLPPSGVAAVLLNVTGTEPTQPTHVRVWPAGDPRPTTSSLNLERGQSRPNQVVVPVGDDGLVALFNNVGSTHLVVDVQGFYPTVDGELGGGYHPVQPRRALDTRWEDEPLLGGEEVWLGLGALGLDSDTVVAVDMNLTVTEPTTAGHLTAWPGDAEVPTVSNVNFARGQTVANHAVVPVTFDEFGIPGIALRASAGATHVVVDVQGWYDDATRTDGLRFSPAPTTRLVDTRSSGTAVAPGGELQVPVTGLPPAVAQVVNVTATGSTRAGHLTVWSGDGPRPSTSTLNFTRGEDSPNMATVPVGTDGQVSVGANSSAVHVVVDHLGYFW